MCSRNGSIDHAGTLVTQWSPFELRNRQQRAAIATSDISAIGNLMIWKQMVEN